MTQISGGRDPAGGTTGSSLGTINHPQSIARPPISADELANGPSTFPYLTPDAMMIYCQTRLTSIDSQCNSVMSKQKKNGETQATLNDLLTELNRHGDGYEPDLNAEKALSKAYDKAIAEVGPDTQLGQKLTNDKAILFVDNDQKVSKEEMASLISSAKSAQSNLNSDSELDMIKLQSLMSQRQTAVQLTTNIVQSLNDQANKIVANIGH